MKRKKGFRKLMAVLVFVFAGLATAGAAHAGSFSQPMPFDEAKTPSAQPAQPQMAAPNPLEGVKHVEITGKEIVVTYEAQKPKAKPRTLTIDYSKIVPSGVTSSSVGGKSPLYYGVVGLVLWSVLGRVRRMVRRVVAHR